MNTKIKLNKYQLYLSIVLVLSALFAQIMVSNAEDESITQLTEAEAEKEKETQEKIEELQKRAEIYREIIDIKKKQGESLNNQLSITDSNLQQVQTKIEESKEKINDYNSQIMRIGSQIREKEAIIASQRKLLTNLIQSYYQLNQTSLAAVYLSGDNIASFMVTKDRVSQAGDSIKEIVDSIHKMKNDLEIQSEEVAKKKGEIVLEHEKLKDESGDLEAVKRKREALISQTKGEEARYTLLLKRVEDQKQELLDIDQYYATSGISADDYPKPSSSSNASLGWYYSQRDPRWADTTIGNTRTLMKSYGCAVAAVAMVSTYHNSPVTPKVLASQPIYSSDLIRWDLGSWDSKITLTSSNSHGNINWSVIDAQLAKKNPVIVYIKKTNGTGGHYVVIHTKEKTGKYVVHDPYFGPNIYLDTSKALVGSIGSNSPVIVDQMIIYN